MLPVEALELITTTVKFRPDQIRKADELRARIQKGRRESVSRADMFRDAVDHGFKVIEAELDGEEGAA